MSPTDEDAAEDVAEDAPDADDSADAEDVGAGHGADAVPSEPLQAIGAAPKPCAPHAERSRVAVQSA